jgi:hypothetical protein
MRVPRFVPVSAIFSISTILSLRSVIRVARFHLRTMRVFSL